MARPPSLGQWAVVPCRGGDALSTETLSPDSGNHETPDQEISRVQSAPAEAPGDPPAPYSEGLLLINCEGSDIHVNDPAQQFSEVGGVMPFYVSTK